MLATCFAVQLAAWVSKAPVDRRAVLSGTAAVALLTSPWPAVATSKEKARQKAIMKETAAETRQAIKEYKYAPRPVVEGTMETGYRYKEGTFQAGSTGEVRACCPH